jgi:hypothetical protein
MEFLESTFGCISPEIQKKNNDKVFNTRFTLRYLNSATEY